PSGAFVGIGTVPQHAHPERGVDVLAVDQEVGLSWGGIGHGPTLCRCWLRLARAGRPAVTSEGGLHSYSCRAATAGAAKATLGTGSATEPVPNVALGSLAVAPGRGRQLGAGRRPARVSCRSGRWCRRTSVRRSGRPPRG